MPFLVWETSSFIVSRVRPGLREQETSVRQPAGAGLTGGAAPEGDPGTAARYHHISHRIHFYVLDVMNLQQRDAATDAEAEHIHFLSLVCNRERYGSKVSQNCMKQTITLRAGELLIRLLGSEDLLSCHSTKSDFLFRAERSWM